MKDRVDFDLIKRFTEGRYAFRDLKRIAGWFEDIRYQAELKSVISRHWDEFSFEPGEAKDLSHIFARLKEQVLAEKAQISPREKFIRVYTRAAAILLLPLLLYFTVSLFQNFRKQVQPAGWVEVVSPLGARTNFELPDGSKVCMNSGTHLKYAANFAGKRSVEVEGEAFFEVVHNRLSPFTVHTSELDVKVLGTKFSVSAQPDEDNVEVILAEGKVQLDGTRSPFSGTLVPDQMFVFNKTTLAGEIKKVNAGQLTAWKDGLLIFRNEPLKEVVKRLGRWYNVRFEISDPEVENFRYRATFKDEPLEEVIRLIALTAPIEYKIEDRKMDDNGVYNTRTIIINKKK